MKVLRIKTEILISAYRAKLEKEGIPFYFYKTGDNSAGAILIKIYKSKGEVELYHRIIDLRGNQKWEILLFGNENYVDNAIKRQCNLDPDIWVLAIDDPRGKKILIEFDEI
tara:strand:- start:424 stop:756 length:333 start_codon:yes stop_codon:yes gene_type:complete